MSKNDELILSLEAVLYGCCLFLRKTVEEKAYYSSDGMIKYEDALSNVIDLMEKLKSEVEE